MWFVYVLRSTKNGRLYTGFTSDLKKRILQHNSGNGGKYSSKGGPFKLVYYEAYINKHDATRAEIFWKSGYGREVLKDKIKYSLCLEI